MGEAPGVPNPVRRPRVARSGRQPAGASAPEELVEELIEKLKSLRSVRLETIDGVEENIQFKLPAELTDINADTASLHRGTG